MSEKNLHADVVDYISLKYPDVPFRTDYSGVRLTPGLAKRMKGLQFRKLPGGYPDIFIIKKTPFYSGLYIELKKKEISGVYKVGPNKGNAMYDLGKPSEEQLLWKKILEAEGFKSIICWGIDQAREEIDAYLSIFKWKNAPRV